MFPAEKPASLLSPTRHQSAGQMGVSFGLYLQEGRAFQLFFPMHFLIPP